jgi:hypothetical protein
VDECFEVKGVTKVGLDAVEEEKKREWGQVYNKLLRLA